MNKVPPALPRVLFRSRRVFPGLRIHSPIIPNRFHNTGIPDNSSRLYIATPASSSSAMNPFLKYVPFAERACEFLSSSPDPFHVVYNCATRLESEGYQRLVPSEPFAGKLKPGGKYFYAVENTTLVAFAVGEMFDPQKPFGFHIIGGHTDSPNLKVKPRSKRSASGCTLLGVECYGGGLWHTWFDRDLSVSGRVLVQRKLKENDDNKSWKTEQHLVKLDDPIARISTLCIHLQSAEERKGFSVNKENHTSPIIATATKHHGVASSEKEEIAKEALEKEASDQLNNRWQENHEPLLLQAIADELEIGVDEIVDFELNLYDTQPASLGGVKKEFIYSARLDNLATVFAAIEGLIDYTSAADGGNDSNSYASSSDIAMGVFFDHEEIGSTSMKGANSPVIPEAVSRISASLNGGVSNPDFQSACLKRSFVMSIDMAHAIHPNYSSKHESTHAPKLNGGFVIKTNSNQRYSTNGITGFVVKELGRISGVPVDEFVVRNDCPCGSTIGPIMSSRTGMRVVDAGMPQLSMHSCREVMGTADLTYGRDIFLAFYKNFRAIDESLGDVVCTKCP